MAQNPNQQPDTVAEVDQAISNSEKFLQENRKRILIGAIVIVLVALGWSLWSSHSQSNNETAQSEMYAGEFLFEEKDYEQALAVFEDVVDNYGSTKAGKLAKAYAGLCQKNLKNYEAAIKYLKSYNGNDSFIAPAVESALGDCYVETADFANAAKHFMNAAKMANNEGMSPLFLFKAGLAYEEMGDKAAALKAYTTIKEKWLTSAIGKEIDKYIYRVQ